MLTLQEILGSDSFATAIQKVNENFKSISLSGGGPQGIRGQQGIPGLPGNQGGTGPIGPVGNNGLSIDIMPFMPTGGAMMTPATGPANAAGISWPASSLAWLQANYGDTGGTFVPTPGMVLADHQNFAYWQYEDGTTPVPLPPLGPLLPQSQDGDAAVWNGYYVSDSWTGPGWYYYPSNIAGIIASFGDVWENDYTTYLTGPDYNYLTPNSQTGPYTVPKARLKSKYGVIWISSHDSLPAPPIPGAELTDARFNQSSLIKNVNLNGYSERSAGVDRLLFKFSLDGRPITEHVAAQSFTGPVDGTSIFGITAAVTPAVRDPLSDAYINPIYGKSLFEYSPLVYLSPWTKDDEGSLDSKEGNFSIFGYQSPTNDPGSSPVQLWVVSHRKQDTPLYDLLGLAIPPTSRNLGEHLIDSRRTITANQYAVLPSQDTAPIDETTNILVSNSPAGQILNGTELTNESGPYVYQGYHSLINGSYINNDYFQRTYYLNGIGQAAASGPWVNNADSIKNNLLGHSFPSSGFALNIYKRAAWYGSSVHSSQPTNGEDTVNEYVRSAGMMERDRIYEILEFGDETQYLPTRADELIFYTAYKESLSGSDVFGEPYIGGVINNQLQSKPVVFMSSSRNVGITTVPQSDIGVLEPHGRFHAHAREFLMNDRGVWDVVTGGNTQSTPKYSKVAIFSSETVDDQGGETGNYTTIKIGRAVSPDYQSESIDTQYTAVPQGGIRFENYNVGELSKLVNTGSLQLGIGLGTSNSTYEINSSDANFLTEWVFAVSPIATGQALTLDDHSDRNKYVAGVGIQERFPKTRFHMYGQNTFRALDETGPNDPEGLFGRSPSVHQVPSGNTQSQRQISLDYVNDSWVTTGGLLDYRYSSTNYNAALLNAVNYPFTEGYVPRVTYGLSVEPSYDRFKTFTGPATSNDGWLKPSGRWFPGGATNPAGVGTSTHGGQYNGWFPINHYQGFNLIRDLSYHGDNKDLTTWKVGADNQAGAAAILTSELGDFAIANIPRWRDGGTSGGIYEQRNLGNRDILNAIKLHLDTSGNLGISNKAGLDANAYPSQFRDANNRVYYVSTFTYPFGVTFYTGPTTTRVAGTDSGGYYIGKTTYPSPANGPYDAGAINFLTTQAENIRVEIGAEKLFAAPGRILQNRGWGYQPTRNSVTGFLNLRYTVWNSSNPAQVYSGTCKVATDSEGRVLQIFFTTGQNAAIIAAFGGGISQTADRFLLQHPTEINLYTAPISATSPGIDSIVFSTLAGPVITWSTVGINKANVRLNNFVAGEGECNLTGPVGPTPGEYIASTFAPDTTTTIAQAARRESPKMILTYEGLDKNRKNIEGVGLIIKANTVIRSNQNETTLRDYWIPKTDNTGGTFMAFTSHHEKVAKDDGIDRTSINKNRLNIDEITYISLDYNHGGLQAEIGADNPLFHPTYITYDYNYDNYGTPFLPMNNAETPDALNWPPAFDNNIYKKYYDVSGTNHDHTLKPLRKRNDASSPPTPTADANGYLNAVEIVKEGITPSTITPTQIRFRRINSEWAMMDYNITLKVNDVFDLYPNIEEDPSSSPIAAGIIPGTFEQDVTRRGLWWLQHGKIRFDIDSGMVVATTLTGPVPTPNYHLTKYGNGMGFRMWSDYNQWYQGTAVAHKGIPNAIFRTEPISTVDRWNKTLNYNSWNWPAMMADYLNANSRVEPILETTIALAPSAPATTYWLTDLASSVVNTVNTYLDSKSYDRKVYVTDALSGESEVEVTVESGVGTATYVQIVYNRKIDANQAESFNFQVPAGCRFNISFKDFIAPAAGVLLVKTYRIGVPFSLDYHNKVTNSGLTWGLSSNTGVLLPFVQALSNRLFFNGTWTDVYDEADGYHGTKSNSLVNLMRQTWTTFGNGAFQKSKTIQWRVLPYNDPGNRSGGYEAVNATGPILQDLPIGNEAGGPAKLDRKENSFIFEFIIPDGILHDPVGGFGKLTSTTGTVNTPELIEANFSQSRDYRFVTLSGQAMVNFQQDTEPTGGGGGGGH